MYVETVMDKIKRGEKIMLYHGSRGGIDGEIEPVSRVRCDFGRGFYMGTNPEQAKGLVVEDDTPVFYTLEVDFSKVDRNKILFLEGNDWLYTVLAHRKKCAEFSELPLADQYIQKAKQYDFIIGAIADDRMKDAVRSYSEYNMTDKGFAACLSAIDYGFQIVAKTKTACRQISIVSEHEIYGQEAEGIRVYNQNKMNQARNIVRDMRIKYRNDGVYLDELINKELNKEKNGEDYD